VKIHNPSLSFKPKKPTEVSRTRQRYFPSHVIQQTMEFSRQVNAVAFWDIKSNLQEKKIYENLKSQRFLIVCPNLLGKGTFMSACNISMSCAVLDPGAAHISRIYKHRWLKK